MKCLIVNGSPRKKGNTAFAVGCIKNGFSQNRKDINVEVINIADYKMSGCLGCNYCRKNNNKCCVNDEANIFVNAVYHADIIIFATPVYFWGISGQLKIAIDRLQAIGKELIGSKKQIGIIAIGADEIDESPQYDLIRQQFECICDFMKWDLKCILPAQALNIGDLEKNSCAPDYNCAWQMFDF